AERTRFRRRRAVRGAGPDITTPRDAVGGRAQRPLPHQVALPPRGADSRLRRPDRRPGLQPGVSDDFALRASSKTTCDSSSASSSALTASCRPPAAPRRTPTAASATRYNQNLWIGHLSWGAASLPR